MASARALLLDEAVPLLTLIGPGGVGKTRLALAIAQAVMPAFADGAAFVDLAWVTDPALVLPATADALGVTETGARRLEERVRACLRERQFLLILDNCEHVIDAASRLAADLLTSCPALQVLATSRAPLRVHGEQILPALPLPLPARPAAGSRSPQAVANVATIEAIALFVQRARAVDPQFALTAGNAETVAEICRRLDGLPLAIELAAARTRLLSPEALLALLSDRLRVLTGGPRDAPPRLRTLRDAIVWSHDLLDADAQALFRRLAVFAGGWDLAAAIAVIGGDPFTVLDGLEALCDQSLLVRAPGGGSGATAPRYGMLETVRAFAVEQLEASDEANAARAAHASHFLALAEEAEAHLRQADQAIWFARLEQEHPNLLAALTWRWTRGENEAALRLAVALGRFWEARCHLAEGRMWLDDLLGTPGVVTLPSPLVAEAFVKAGLLAWVQGDFATAARRFEQSLVRFREAGDPSGTAVALSRLALAAKMRGDLERATMLFDESVALFEGRWDDYEQARLGQDLGHLHLSRGDLESAERLLIANLEPARRSGDVWLLASTLYHLGESAARQGDDARAEPLLEEALASFQTIGETRWVAAVWSFRGLRAAKRGDPERAQALIADALAVYLDLGVQFAIAESLERMAWAATSSRAEQAARLLGAADALRQAIGWPRWPVDQTDHERAVAAARARLGDERFAAAWAAGRRLSGEAAVAEALAIAAAPRRGRNHSEEASWTGAGSMFGLSRREREVLRLMAQGQTDKEIAGALFLSPRTVNTHVARLFAKLGVNNRRAAAALAVRYELD